MPSGPRIGEAITSRVPRPRPRAVAAVSRSTRRCTSRSFTTPPLASARPASNWGLTRATMGPLPSRKTERVGPRISASEMKATSMTAMSAGSGRIPGASVRAFTRSIDTTRPSRRSFSASWPYPTSTAYTRAAPRARSTSVNPPVDAPTSMATSPAGSMANASSAAISLCAPRLTHSRPPATVTVTSRPTRSPALRSWRAPSPSPTRTCPASRSAWARERVGANPRSSRSWSRRTRLAVAAGMVPIVAQPAYRGRMRVAGRRDAVPHASQATSSGTLGSASASASTNAATSQPR